MAFGNGVGIDLDPALDSETLFCLEYGSIVLELPHGASPESLFAGLPGLRLGDTTDGDLIRGTGWSLPLAEALSAWRAPLDDIFPRTAPAPESPAKKAPSAGEHPPWKKRHGGSASTRPRVLIPVFPGTNCEYDTAAAFERAGALTESLIVRNLTPAMVEESIHATASALKKSQILMIPGGFSGRRRTRRVGKVHRRLLP